MQKQSRVMLLMAASFILLAGFKKDNHVSPSKGPVTITAVFDFSTFPDVLGTFTTTGALTVSGPAEMIVGPNTNGVRAHCIVTLTAPDGIITIHQQCQFSTDPPLGRWEIVAGTGAYANLKGNGSLTMPPNTEAMEGTIY